MIPNPDISLANRGEIKEQDKIKPKIIGLSLSSCIADIVSGLVDEQALAYIIANTRIIDEASLDRVIKKYISIYWSQNPARSEEICRRLFQEGRIIQPRLKNSQYKHPIVHGHWIKDTQLNDWKAYQQAIEQQGITDETLELARRIFETESK